MKNILRFINIYTIILTLLVHSVFLNGDIAHALPLTNKGPEVVTPVEIGDFFISELSDIDVEMLVQASSGDPFGLDQEFPDPANSPHIKRNVEFGESLINKAASQEKFLENTTFEITEEGHFKISEIDAPQKYAYGREHTFKSFKFKNYKIANDFIFLEVDNKSLPKSRQGIEDSKLSSLVVVRLNDVINYMGMRKLLMTIMPLPTSVENIEEIKYQPRDELPRKNKAISALLKREYNSGSYTIIDKAGKSLWIPEHLPDVYTDLTRLLIRNISAAYAPNRILNEKLAPNIERYMSGLSQFIEKQNEKNNEIFHKMISGFIEKGNPEDIHKLSSIAFTEFIRSGYVEEINSPTQGNWLNKSYGKVKVTKDELKELRKLFNEEQIEIAKEYKEATTKVNAETKIKIEEANKKIKDIDSPEPTAKEIKIAEEALEEITEEASRFSDNKIVKLVKNTGNKIAQKTPRSAAFLRKHGKTIMKVGTFGVLFMYALRNSYLSAAGQATTDFALSSFNFMTNHSLLLLASSGATLAVSKIFKGTNTPILKDLHHKLKFGLGNIVGLVGMAGSLGALGNIPAAHEWTTNILTGMREFFSKEALELGIRANATIMLGWFGLLTGALVGGNKVVNYYTGAKRSVARALGEIAGMQQIVFNNLISPNKTLTSILQPRYNKIVATGAVPTKENGAKKWIFSETFTQTSFIIKDMYKRLFDKSYVDFNKINQDEFVCEVTDCSVDKALNNIKDEEFVDKPVSSVIGKIKAAAKGALNLNKKVSKKRNHDLYKASIKEGAFNLSVKETVFATMLPQLSKELDLTMPELILAMSHSPMLFESEQFIDENLSGIIDNKLTKNDTYAKALQKFEKKSKAIEARKYRLLKTIPRFLNNYFAQKALKKEKKKYILKTRADLKTIYYMTLHEIHLENSKNKLLASGDDDLLDKDRVKEVMLEAIQKQKEMRETKDKIKIKAYNKQLQSSIDFHKKVYFDTQKYKTIGESSRQYVALAQFNEENLGRMLRQVSKDYPMERVQSYGEFHETLAEQGKSFYSEDLASSWSNNHTFGVHEQDAPHAMKNSIDWVLAGTLSSSNLVNRASADAVDKSHLHYGFIASNLRQFFDPIRYRQLHINKNIFFEYVRSMKKTFNKRMTYSFLLTHILFYGELRPDLMITTLTLYLPLLIAGDYIQTKLEVATGALEFDKDKVMKVFQDNVLAKAKLKNPKISKLTDLKFADKAKIWLKRVSTINPQNYYQMVMLFVFNALTFFVERWASESGGGSFYLLTKFIGSIFGHPEWATTFKHMIGPNAVYIFASLFATYVAKWLYVDIKKKFEARRLVSSSAGGKCAGLLSSLFKK